MNIRLSMASCLVAVLATTFTAAQAPGAKRTMLQRIDVGNNMEMVVVIAEIAPGGAIGRHTHFGVESGYVLSGSASMEVEGETPKLVKAGDSFVIPAHKIHDAKAVGDAPAKVVVTYVVEKGKPLATPAN
jgi:quercetin dioxygenase-like cupin family protein